MCCPGNWRTCVCVWWGGMWVTWSAHSQLCSNKVMSAAWFSSSTINECPFCRIFGAMFFSFLCSLLVILWCWSSNDPKPGNPVICVKEKIHVLRVPLAVSSMLLINYIYIYIYLNVSFFFLHFLNWSIVDSQCYVNFCCRATWFSYTYVYFPFYTLFHYILNEVSLNRNIHKTRLSIDWQK